MITGVGVQPVGFVTQQDDEGVGVGYILQTSYDGVGVGVGVGVGERGVGSVPQELVLPSK